MGAKKYNPNWLFYFCSVGLVFSNNNDKLFTFVVKIVGVCLIYFILKKYGKPSWFVKKVTLWDLLTGKWPESEKEREDDSKKVRGISEEQDTKEFIKFVKGMLVFLLVLLVAFLIYNFFFN
jgi:hypothetical protein